MSDLKHPYVLSHMHTFCVSRSKSKCNDFFPSGGDARLEKWKKKKKPSKKEWCSQYENGVWKCKGLARKSKGSVKVVVAALSISRKG